MIEKPVKFGFKVYPCGVEVTGIEPLPSVCPEHAQDWPALSRIAAVLTQEMSLRQVFTGCEPLCLELLAAIAQSAARTALLAAAETMEAEAETLMSSARIVSNMGRPTTDNSYGRAASVWRAAAKLLITRAGGSRT